MFTLRLGFLRVGTVPLLIGLWLGIFCAVSEPVKGQPAGSPVVPSAANDPKNPAVTTVANPPAIQVQPATTLSSSALDSLKKDDPEEVALRMMSKKISLMAYGIALVLVAAIAGIFLYWFRVSLRQGQPPAFELNWGGIGGGLSGWQLNHSLTLFLGSVIFAGLFCCLVLRGPPQLNPAAEGTSTPTIAPPAVTEKRAPTAKPAD